MLCTFLYEFMHVSWILINMHRCESKQLVVVCENIHLGELGIAYVF